MRETRTVSFFTCDCPTCTYAVYREVDADGLPAGYHAQMLQVDGDGNARGVDVYACTWDHLTSSTSQALEDRAIDAGPGAVPQHPSQTDEMLTGNGGLQGASTDRRRIDQYESSYDHTGGSEATSFVTTDGEKLELGGTSYAAGHA